MAPITQGAVTVASKPKLPTILAAADEAAQIKALRINIHPNLVHITLLMALQSTVAVEMAMAVALAVALAVVMAVAAVGAVAVVMVVTSK